MRKEIFKNITMVTLIFISVLLFSKIWFGEYLIPGKEFIIRGSAGEVQTIAVEGIIMPKRIVITGNDKRHSVLKGMEEYNGCYEAVKEFFIPLSGKNIKFEVVAEQEWTAALKSKSVLLDYGSECSSDVLSKTTMTLPEGNIKEIIITPGTTVMSKPSVYVKNTVSGEILKASPQTGYGSISQLMTSYLSGENVSNLPFAFELGFDRVKSSAQDISLSTLLDSNIIIGLKDISVPEIKIVKPDKAWLADEMRTDALLSVLGFKPASTRRYIEKDDALVFVDSNATLKIHSGGFIEYMAENGGIPLSGDGKNDVSRSVETMYSLVRAIAKTYSIPEQQIQVYSDITDNMNTSAEIYMDYYAGGVPVIIKGESGIEHTIGFTLKDGMIVGFKQYLYSFEKTGVDIGERSMVSAINRFNEKHSSEALYISDLYSAYIAEGETVSVKWCAKSGDKDTIEIIN